MNVKLLRLMRHHHEESHKVTTGASAKLLSLHVSAMDHLHQDSLAANVRQRSWHQ